MATLDITVWGEKMRLSSDLDEEFIQQVADYLNEKMGEVQAHDATLLTTKIAALRVAYLIAAEYLMIKKEVGKLEFALDEIEARFDSLQL